MRYMNKAQSLSVDSLRAILAVISVPWYSMIGLLYFLLILFLMIWLFNISQLVTIVNTYPSELPRVLLEGYINLFLYGFNFIPIMLVLISLFQSINLVLVKFIRNNSTISANVSRAPLLSGLFGAGCVACGGSIIAPLISLTGAASVVQIAGLLSSGFLFLALGIAMYSVCRMGKQASLILSREGNS